MEQPMTPDIRQQALRRLKILFGQLQALERQIDEDKYCMDVLDLSMSIQKALRSLDGLVITDGWPQNRPQLLIDAAATHGGQAPANFSRQLLADRAWYSYSFNAPWDPARPQLVPAVRAWLRRFDGRS